MELRASSGARLEVHLQVQAVEATAAEGCILRLGGSTHAQHSFVVLGGQYEASDLESQRTYARASLGSRIRVAAVKMLEAGAHTGRAVEYRGDPEENNVRYFITGNIRKVYTSTRQVLCTASANHVQNVALLSIKTSLRCERHNGLWAKVAHIQRIQMIKS